MDFIFEPICRQIDTNDSSVEDQRNIQMQIFPPIETIVSLCKVNGMVIIINSGKERGH
jgi:hypothetical protein